MKSPVKIKSQALLFLGWIVIVSPAFAGLFTNEELPKKIQQLEARVSKLEAMNKKLEEASRKLEEANRKLEETNKQQARSMLDLQSQIEAQVADIRILRGHNEEFSHELKESKQRQKDFYVDLDTRLRSVEAAAAVEVQARLDLQTQIEAQIAETRALRGHNEELVHDLQEAKQRQKDFYVDLDARLRSVETAATIEAQAKKEAQTQKDAINAENLAYEGAHSSLATKDHTRAISTIQEFIKQYPQSVHILNAHYDLGEAYFQAEDYKKSLVNFQRVAGSSSQNPKVVEAMFRSVDCQVELKDRDAAKGTLKKIISNYPGTAAAEKAKKRLASLK
ncbi:MAG: tol-pal system protein YbgF [Candidatus Nitrotoga sp.]